VCRWQVKLCDPFVTHRPCLSTLEIKGLYIKCYINSSVYFLEAAGFIYCYALIKVGHADTGLKSTETSKAKFCKTN